jgi:hypothetical protein
LVDTALTRVELVATDGVTQRKVLWIDAKENGVYLGFCEQGQDSHTSYHRDGNVFSTINGKLVGRARFQRLDDFKNAQSVSSFGFPPDLRGFRGVDYVLKEVDAVVYLDVRPFQKERGFINCLVYLLEPQRFDLLKNLAKLPGLKQIQIFTNYQPWIVVSILCIRQGNSSQHGDVGVVIWDRRSYSE